METVRRETERLRACWKEADPTRGRNDDVLLRRHLGATGAEDLDPFDRVQLLEVLRTLSTSRSLSDAGRKLFAVSRLRKRKANDADRLRKYLARFDVDWHGVVDEAWTDGATKD